MLAFKPRVFHVFKRDIIKTNWRKINEGPLKKAGLLARKIEIQLIRKDKSKKQNPSKPGRPPKSRAPGHPFRRIYSVVSPLETNVIIGHIGFHGGQTAMEIQEFGQKVTITRPQPRLRKGIQDAARRRKVYEMIKSGKIKIKPQPMVTKTIKMPERPFAFPTTQIVARRLPPMWANSVRPGTVQGA